MNSITKSYRVYTLKEKAEHITETKKSDAPRSTAFYWMHSGKVRIIQEAKNEGVLDVLDHNKKTLRHSYDSIMHTLEFFMSTVSRSKSLKKYYKNNRLELLIMIDKLKAFVPLDELLLCFGMSSRTYTSLKNKMICSLSLSKNCLNSVTNQIHNDMVLELKDLYFHNPKFIDFSLSDLFAEVLFQRKIFISQTKFREIAVALGEDVKRKKVYSRPVTEGLKTYSPNSVIQADKTCYKLSNGVKAWIYLVIDHYSRKILAAHVSFSSKSKESLYTLKSAIEDNNLNNIKFKYMTDAGSENKGKVKEYISGKKNIFHVIAQTEAMKYSNSMVESVIKYFKREILKRKFFKTIDELTLAVSEGVETYNNRRRIFLNGATPNEFYVGNEPNKIEYDILYRESMKKRIQINKEYNCMKPCQIPLLKDVSIPEFG